MRIALALVVVAGCSSGGDLAFDDLNDALVSKYCDIYDRCGILEHDACMKALGSALSFDPDLAAAYKAGKVIYHGDKARTCIDSFDTGTCDRKFFSGGPGLDSAACSATFEGTVHADGACAIDDECISKECDVPACNDLCCMGTCVGDEVPVHDGSVGAACQATSDCNADNFCDTVTGTCAAELADGAACEGNAQCQSYYCMGTCQTVVAEGAACTSSQQCKLLQDSCNSQNICSPGNADGAACTSTTDCKLASYCGSTSKQCTPRPVLGEACKDTGSCIDGSRCDDETDTCMARVGAGGACKVSSDCESRNCDTSGGPGICIAELACY